MTCLLLILAALSHGAVFLSLYMSCFGCSLTCLVLSTLQHGLPALEHISHFPRLHNSQNSRFDDNRQQIIRLITFVYVAGEGAGIHDQCRSADGTWMENYISTLCLKLRSFGNILYHCYCSSSQLSEMVSGQVRKKVRGLQKADFIENKSDLTFCVVWAVRTRVCAGLKFCTVGVVDESCIFERLDSEDALRDAFGAFPGAFALASELAFMHIHLCFDKPPTTKTYAFCPFVVQSNIKFKLRIAQVLFPP